MSIQHEQLNQIVVFSIDEQRYALPLYTVEKIISVVEVTPLPKGPDIVLGVINMQGRIIPVLNIRRHFRLPEREINLSDRLIIANTYDERTFTVSIILRICSLSFSFFFLCYGISHAATNTPCTSSASFLYKEALYSTSVTLPATQIAASRQQQLVGISQIASAMEYINCNSAK